MLVHHPLRLLVVVSDPGEGTPSYALTEPTEFSEGGRGLLTVQAISSAWGYSALTRGGKAVWTAFGLKRATHQPGPGWPPEDRGSHGSDHDSLFYSLLR